MRQIKVEQNEAGQRLDKLLSKVLNKAPKSFIYKMLRKKNIVLNGKKADGSEKLKQKDEVTLYLAEETIEKFSEPVVTTDVEHGLAILYEDENIMVINKPYGLLSQKAEKTDISVVEHMISYLVSTGQLSKDQLQTFKPGVCNRLDRNTSGILIAGKSLIGLQEMARLLKDRNIDKYYLCIVKGKIREKKQIEGYLVKNHVNNTVTVHSSPMEGADYIRTEYQPLSYRRYHNDTNESAPQGFEEFTLLQVKLITGRSHQIRAHLASIGHPLIGDFKYGNRKMNQYIKNKYGLSHQLLHSYKMKFPTIEGPLSYLSQKEFTAELPELFQRIQKELLEQ